MAYELRPGRPIGHEVRRLARDTLAEAIDLLEDPEREGLATSVHEARKRTKMVRALGRLISPGIGRPQRRVNRLLRDGSRELSALRDAHALLATWDRLAGVDPGIGELTSVREGLVARSAAPTAESLEPGLARAIERFERARELVSSWDLPDGLGAVRLGLRESQRGARASFAAARRDPTDQHLHDLRKRMKDLWYHGRLVRPSAPSMLDAYVQVLHGLSDALGDDHDLATLLVQVRAAPADFGGDGAVDAVAAALTPVRAELQHRAIAVSARVVAESPKAFARRLSAYLELGNDLGDEPAIGGVDDVLEAGPSG